MARCISRLTRIIGGFLCCLTGVVLLLVLCTNDPRDPSFFIDVAPFDPNTIQTWGGWWGATIAAFVLRACGVSAFLLCPLLLLCACFLWRFVWADATRLGGALLIFLAGLFTAGALTIDPSIGGHWGSALYCLIVPHVDPFFVTLGVPFLFIIGMMALVRFSWAAPLHRGFSLLCRCLGLTALVWMLGSLLHSVRTQLAHIGLVCKKFFLGEPYFALDGVDEEDDNPAPLIPSSIIQLSEPASEAGGEAREVYRLPLDTLFGPAAVEQEKVRVPSVEAKNAARVLETKLRQFGIEGEIVEITTGPTVTLFAYAPATDVKLSRIVALEDDLALAIEARSLRVIAPMPGTAYVGLEVANRTSEPVFFADLVRRTMFRDKNYILPLILGKNSIGNDRVIDLVQQPHLLIAGSTGAGKSVGLHAMITGLLSSRSPDELRLVLIDPKRLEFAGYTDVAHLLVPVVTDGGSACRVLSYLTVAMEKRYQQMAQAGVRNIQEFHRVHSAADMPYIVVVIDELADLMMIAGKDLEISLIRLAQMARAAGIHLIVATQRPSVDVLTGLIKVNFPARIAFKVASKTDARTILDQSGAERLLGRGDMLFLDPRGGLERIQGAYVSDDEVRDVVACIRGQRATDYLVIAEEHVGGGTTDEADPLLGQVVEFVRTVEEISISLIQRRFRIGFNRSARLVDQLERRGVILPSQGGKMRRVAHDSSIT